MTNSANDLPDLEPILAKLPREPSDQAGYAVTLLTYLGTFWILACDAFETDEDGYRCALAYGSLASIDGITSERTFCVSRGTERPWCIGLSGAVDAATIVGVDETSPPDDAQIDLLDKLGHLPLIENEPDPGAMDLGDAFVSLDIGVKDADAYLAVTHRTEDPDTFVGVTFEPTDKRPLAEGKAGDVWTLDRVNDADVPTWIATPAKGEPIRVTNPRLLGREASGCAA